jgi:hypothetical protein
MTGSEGRNSLEQATADIVGRGYDQPDSASSNGSSGEFHRTCYASEDGRPSENGAQPSA